MTLALVESDKHSLDATLPLTLTDGLLQKGSHFFSRP